MNGTPRGLNRVLLALIGLVFMAFGGGLFAIAVVPAAASWWQGWAGPWVSELDNLLRKAPIAPNGGSWIWLVVSLALLLLVIGMVSWIANQGKGRTGTLLDYEGNADDDGAAGAVKLSSAVAEHSLRTALLERGDLLGVSVTSYDFQGQTSIRVRVLPRQGVAPHQVADDVADLVQAMDDLLGHQVPVLLSIGSGTRSRFTKAERVR